MSKANVHRLTKAKEMDHEAGLNAVNYIEPFHFTHYKSHRAHFFLQPNLSNFELHRDLNGAIYTLIRYGSLSENKGGAV